MREWARAKVNLYLHVVGRRADGYHLLDSLVVFPGAADLLHAEPAATLGLRVEGRFGAGLAAEPDNLVLRAARALQRQTGVARGAAMVLDKSLPVASGIGGGSADAAAALRLLCRLWDVAPDTGALAAMAQALGADVPVCLPGRPARMGGIGEQVSGAPALPAFGLMLVNPGVAVATPAVFRARAPGYSQPATLPTAWTSAATMAADLRDTRNDLEPTALRLCPAIATVLDWLRARDGCLLARMSGSGATCFALFPDADTARLATHGMPAAWWGWAGEGGPALQQP